MSNIAVGTIKLYRRYLSPHKGFRCAHNALHASGSCSDFGLRAFRRYDLGSAVASMNARFNACRTAHTVLMAGPTPDDEARWDKERAIDRANRQEARKFQFGDCPGSAWLPGFCSRAGPGCGEAALRAGLEHACSCR
jgi:putative component of membrane protein insertase Oxa1/YidC/SpoIIIJ protein YidD